MDSNLTVRAIMLRDDNADVLAKWSRGVQVEEIDPFDAEKKFPGLNVQCGDTVKRASLGDFVIKHEDGTYDVKTQLDFIKHYVKIDD